MLGGRKDIPEATEPFCAFQIPRFLCGIEMAFEMNMMEAAFHVRSPLSQGGGDVYDWYRVVKV